MKLLNIITKEILYRKQNFLLCLLAIILSMALLTVFFTTGQASKRETSKLMQDVSFNIRIVPKKTDVHKFWVMGFSDNTMPEHYFNILAKNQNIIYITAMLQKKILLNDQEAILTGVISDKDSHNEYKNYIHTNFNISSGNVYLGYEIALIQGIEKGGNIVILNKPFKVERILSESGSADDIRIYGNLHDVQKLIKMEGKINEIRALEFLPISDSEQILPEAKIIRNQAVSLAWKRQNIMVSKYFILILIFVLIASALWIAVLTMLNVRERQSEIGIMRALGFNSRYISSLFIGRALIIGFIGAIVGFATGTCLSILFASDIFKDIKPLYELFALSLVISPIFTALSSLIPIMVAVAKDPATTLTKE